MAILGIDYGLKHVGLAISRSGFLASPLGEVEYQGQELIKEIKQLVELEQVSLIVVGLPLGDDGAETDQSKLTRQFVRQLKKSINIELHLVDESNTTFEAALQAGSKNIHSHAAVLILQDYLNQQTD